MLAPQARKPGPAPTRARNDCRLLVWVDSAPQRRAESKAYVDLKRKIAAAAAEIEQFQQVTLPEFEQWHARAFGALLTEQRSLRAAIEEKLALVQEVGEEQWRRGGSEAAAYQRVLRARARQEAGLAEEDLSDDDDFEAEEAEFRAMFQEAVLRQMGVDVSAMDPEEREILESTFRHAFGAGNPAGDPPPPKASRKKEKPLTPQQRALEERCKQIYRALVRRLHPDTGVESTPQTRQLWHDLQDAWQRRDVERLEVLQAVVELQDGGTEAAFAAVSLDRLRRIVRDLARAWQEVQKERRSLQRHPASQRSDPRKARSLETMTRAGLKREIEDLQRGIREVDALIARWQKTKPRGKAGSGSAGQDEFAF